MKSIYSVLSMIILACFLSCQNASNDKAVSVVSEKQEEVKYKDEGVKDEYRADTVGGPQNPGEQKQTQQSPQQPPVKVDWDKKIVKTAILNAEVKDYNLYYASLREKVRSVGGYIAQEEQSQSGYKKENAITIKVPVDQFDNAVVLLATGTEKINEKKISSQDVTTEMIDTRSRLEAKKQVRLRYLELLRQAHNMQDILSVQGEINGIQEEIEAAAGRIAYLGNSSSYSTIHLNYYQVLNVTAKEEVKPTFWSRVGGAFGLGLFWVSELFIRLMVIWPLFLFLFGGIFLYKKLAARKSKVVVENK